MIVVHVLTSMITVSFAVRSSICLRWLQLMSNVVLDVFLSIVCVTLGPKTVISRGEQNRYGWRRRTSYSAAEKIIRRLAAYKVYGGLRRLTAAARGSTPIPACLSLM